MKISPKPCKKKLFGHADVQKSQTSIWRRIAITALCLSFIAANTAVTLAAGLSVNESHFVSEETDDILYDEDTVYTLYLTHVFRFTSDGQGRNVQAAEKLELTEADFENGVCDLRRFIYEEAQLTVTEAEPLHIEDFDENREGGARIVYAVKRGWKVVPTEDAENKGSVLREVFNGQLGDYAFVPAEVIRLQMEYRYSNTGGLVGIFAADPSTVEVMPEKQEDGTYQVEWTLPTVEGFRIVMNPEPLNQYLVKPPTGNETAAELEEALERGDFNVDIDHHQVYYYQEKNDPDHTVLNPTYGNRYSMEYNQAWNQARALSTATYTAAAMGEHDETAASGANPLEHPRLKVTLTEEQLAEVLEGEMDLDITVYYRRNATWYTVNHWVPKVLSGLDDFTDMEIKTVDHIDYVRLQQETLQGRVGATTSAEAMTDGIYEKLEFINFSQKLIENTTSTTGTTVDLYYKAADSYRVIFDTNYTYIPRQQVRLGNQVDFGNVTKPTRMGYTFAGWRYLKKDAQPDASGTYSDDAYEEVQLDAGGSPQLTVNDALIAKAKLQATGGVLALHLYPKWVPEKTQVRVILWTEDLTGMDDVQAIAEGGNAETEDSYYKEKYADYQSEPKTHSPELGHPNSNYSNMGSFTLDVMTDASLLNPGNDKTLLDAIQTQVTTEFGKAMGQENGVDAAQFYSQAEFQIIHETEDGQKNDVTTASGDGKTMIYVYFTRNIYTLKFHYYGKGWQDYPYYIATNTSGFSRRGAEECVENGVLNFNFDANGTYGNIKKRAAVNSHEEMPVPQTITIKAKYGADLQDVWPISRHEESVTAEGKTAVVTSWAVTDGKFRTDALEPGNSHYDEFAIKGTYGSMGAEVIAKPEDPGNVHHMVAYWRYGISSNYFRYTHCYEVPELDVTDMQKVSIYNDDTTNPKNFLYLVPVGSEALAKYQFHDLMVVSYKDGQIRYNDPDGNYYAVRQYTKNGETKYYAVARQVIAMSTNRIDKQVPSARPHLTRVNGNADHSSQYRDSDGAQNASRIGTAEAPYDLYFYYDRDRYQITYMAPIHAENSEKSEVTLGTIKLPYGALVTQEKYGFSLCDTDQNTEQAYAWDVEADGYHGSVCPDRSENGTAAWKFKGWGLGPAGLNMQWTMPENIDTQGQAAEVFAIASNLRLYAIWETPTYTVTFHLHGGKVDREQIVVKVPANTRYSANGSIPRPFREGYTLSGWYQADEDGTITAPNTAFDFDQTITENKHVAAAWEAVSTETFDYNIYYVTRKLHDGDQDKDYKTVQIADDKIVESGGKTYYVLEKAAHKDQVFIPGVTLNHTAQMYLGYIPQVTNRALKLETPDDTYDVIFYYDPIITNKHVVNFVEAGTEQSTNPVFVKTIEAEADQAVVTPQPDAVKALAAKGYVLVNKNHDGSYTQVEQASDLTWIDEDGSTKPIATLTGEQIPAVITYLVQPTSYTITYLNADGSPAGAAHALQAVTAEKNTSVAAAKGKNPTCYTTKDSFSIKHPASIMDNGKRYQFSHWSLGSDTTEEEHKDTFSTLKVETGTVGNLTFVANWTEDLEEPDQPTTPDGSEQPDRPIMPEEPDQPTLPEEPDEPDDPEPPIDIEDPDVPKGDEPSIDIEDPSVPKAEQPQSPDASAKDTAVMEAPQTGDRENIWWYFGICVLASALIVLTKCKSQKKK